MHGHAEAGVYCQEFAQYIATGAEGIPFEGKVTAIEVVTLSLIPRILNFNQAVILIDYRHIKKQRNKLFRHINLSKIFYNSEEVTCLIDDAAD